jgi:hypothetical protein
MNTHGPLITNIVFWFTILSPLIFLIVSFLASGSLN